MALDHVAASTVANLNQMAEGLGTKSANALVKTDAFEAILMHLTADKPVPEHKVDGPIIVQCLHGKVDFSVEGESHIMQSGDWMHLAPGALHALKAFESTFILVTILFPNQEGQANRLD